jgi:hypothetical protein
MVFRLKLELKSLSFNSLKTATMNSVSDSYYPRRDVYEPRDQYFREETLQVGLIAELKFKFKAQKFYLKSI